jgi:hypothetical protein
MFSQEKLLEDNNNDLDVNNVQNDLIYNKEEYMRKIKDRFNLDEYNLINNVDYRFILEV